MLLFGTCLPLSMKKTTPLRMDTVEKLLSPDDPISSVGTSFKTCKTAFLMRTCIVGGREIDLEYSHNLVCDRLPP